MPPLWTSWPLLIYKTIFYSFGGKAKEKLNPMVLSSCSERKGRPGITNHVWSLHELLAL
jgi:hypothetical protein